jgi:hypothetical protein
MTPERFDMSAARSPVPDRTWRGAARDAALGTLPFKSRSWGAPALQK